VTISVTFSPEQARAASALCDIAVKAGGLPIANAAFTIAGMIEQAIAAAEKDAPPLAAP
jgi:hypothetical protein